MRSFRPLLLGTALLVAACATVKPPAVTVSGIHLNGVSLTGARVDVGLLVRNVNPEDLNIERFEYEIKLNGQSLGRGFSGDPLMLGGFKEDRVVSRVDVNLLKVPGVVKNALDKDRVAAEIKGTFYVRDGDSLRKVKFGTHGDVDLKK
jgi:LEA14-like dessication related protein